MYIVLMVIVVIASYFFESLFLSKVALKHRKNPVLAWIPGISFLLTRHLAGKKTRFGWILGLVLVALFFHILGDAPAVFSTKVVIIVGCFFLYWGAFYTLVEKETDLSIGWVGLSVFCEPVKLYVMYKMAKNKK